MDDRDKRRLAEEEIQDPKKRAAAEKPNLAVSASWWLVGVLVLAFIVAAAL